MRLLYYIDIVHFYILQNMDYIVYAFEITCNKLITYHHYVEMHSNIGRCLIMTSVCRRKRENDYEDSIKIRTLEIS